MRVILHNFAEINKTTATKTKDNPIFGLSLCLWQDRLVLFLANFSQKSYASQAR